jgi:2-deoxy-D-gluconate 3-dehydrogenase
MDLFDLTGKTALVTGGTRGLGAEMALGLATAGADVILIVRSTANLSTKTAIESLHRKCHLIIQDLSDEAAVNTLIPRITAIHSFSILVNAAGIQRRHPAASFPQSAFNDIMQSNLGSVFALCRDTGAYWLATGIPGRIINTASMATFQGGVNMAAYACSKGGVGQLTKALSNEWAGRGIAVNAIAPGYIATDMNEDTRTDPDTRYYDSITERIPAGRWGRPEEFRGPVVFLASQAASYVTGEILVVDGGWMAR